MSKKWYHQLRDAKFKEFSFFPNAYTPMEEDKSVSLPPIELEYGGAEEETSEKEDGMPQWVKNVSFTIAGVTIGGAAVYSLFATAPAPSCPAPVSTTQEVVQSPLPSPSTQNSPAGGASSGTPPRTTGTPAGATTTNSSAGSAGNATSTTSSGGTL